MEYTTEILANLYKMAEEFARVKFSYGTPDRIRLTDSGMIGFYWDSRYDNDYDYEEIHPKELTLDLLIVAEERKQREALAKEAEEQRRLEINNRAEEKRIADEKQKLVELMRKYPDLTKLTR